MSVERKESGKLNKVLEDWKLRVALVVAVAGAEVFLLGVVDELLINTHEKVRTDTQQLIPDYDPEKIEAKMVIVDTFNSFLDNNKSLETPQAVSSAEKFIEENRESYNRGKAAEQKVYNKRQKKKLVGGVIGLSGFLAFNVIKSTKEKQSKKTGIPNNFH